MADRGSPRRTGEIYDEERAEVFFLPWCLTFTQRYFQTRPFPFRFWSFFLTFLRTCGTVNLLGLLEYRSWSNTSL